MEMSAAKPIANAQNVMQLEHPKLGVIAYSADDIFFFPQGLLGYERQKHYILVEREEHQPFLWMLNTEDTNLNFLIIDPQVFYPEYEPNISKRDLNELQIDNPQSLFMYIIITLDQDIHKSTGNLSAPILLNMTKRIGKQLVLLDDKYSTKYPIHKPE
ncbi:MAG: flagellar assembly protein FliW [Deferribacteres bacterium]|nr:flagellar assembly protein FliW [Deferribacteres bacterium]